jgi:hypothetical protein
VFILAFVVEVVVRYNLIMHKTQPQKLIFLVFLVFLLDFTPKTQPPLLKQIEKLKNFSTVWEPCKPRSTKIQNYFC